MREGVVQLGASKVIHGIHPDSKHYWYCFMWGKTDIGIIRRCLTDSTRGYLLPWEFLS